MSTGHLATGLVLKKMQRSFDFGWVFFTGLFHDFLFGILVLLGVEHRRTPISPLRVLR